MDASERWSDDPESTSGGALEAKRCECRTSLVDDSDAFHCVGCGREIRALGALGREYRFAEYVRLLMWGAGAGLSRQAGFRGISRELGPNPDPENLKFVLELRVARLPKRPPGEDPFEGELIELRPDTRAEPVAA